MSTTTPALLNVLVEMPTGVRRIERVSAVGIGHVTRVLALVLPATDDTKERVEEMAPDQWVSVLVEKL